MSTSIRDVLLRAVQRSRERHSPPIVSTGILRWPTSAPTTPGLIVEELEYYVEEGAQGWVPLRIVKPADVHNLLLPPTPSPSVTALSPAASAAAEPPQAPAHAPAAAHSHGASSIQFSPAAAAAGAMGTPRISAVEAASGSARGQSDEGDGDQGPKGPAQQRRPVLLIMHATGESMDVVRHKQELYARMGFFTAAIDARYHGQRAAVPYEVGAALNAAVQSGPPAAAGASSAFRSGAVSSPRGVTAPPATANALLSSVKGIKPQVLAALERADAAAGLSAVDGGVSAEASMQTVVTAARSTQLPVPVGSRTAAADARQEAAAEQRRQAYQRFVDAWLGVVSEFRERRGDEATAAVLATAPPPVPLGVPTPLPALSSSASVSTTAGSAAALALPGAAAAVVAMARAVANGNSHRGPAVARADKVTARNVYELALTAAWRGSGERPLFLDTVWDLVMLLDVLALRDDVDMERVGMTGFSMGGTITWLLSVIDPRVAVMAPAMGVQGFRWGVENEAFMARVGRYPLVFEVAASDLRGTKEATIDAEVVSAVWNKLLPDMLDHYDAPLSLPTLLPRPLLIITGELDASCPLTGVEQAAEATHTAYLQWAEEQRRQHQLALQEAAEAAAAAAEAAAAEAAEVVAAATAAASETATRTATEGGSEAASHRETASGRGTTGGGDGSGIVHPAVTAASKSSPGGTGSGSMSGSMRGSDPDAVRVGGSESGRTSSGRSSTRGSARGTQSRLARQLEAAGETEAAWAAVAAATATAEEDAIFAEMEAAAAIAAAEAAAAAASAAAAAAAAAAKAEAERQEQLALDSLLASRYRFLCERGVGHTETHVTRRAVEDWMVQHLLVPWKRAVREEMRCSMAACQDGEQKAREE